MKNILLYYLADGKTVDATQEMLALGACNLISSFVGSMPISGALSRGAVNNASGVKTTFGGVYTGKKFRWLHDLMIGLLLFEDMLILGKIVL